MEPESTLLRWELLATFPYPKPDQARTCLPIPLLEEQFFTSSSHLRLGLPSSLFPSALFP
jgi:hypothetical protein